MNLFQKYYRNTFLFESLYALPENKNSKQIIKKKYPKNTKKKCYYR